ncbi:MAG: hypothetical protein Q8Q03_00690 [bacterium]|nr:hypothetical protein [bacterium]
MLTPYSSSKFITKTLTSASGEQFRVVFLVSFVNGEVKAQVVSAKKISVVCLPEFKEKSPVTFTYTPASSPVVSLFNPLFFFNSQPTRAPAY